MEDDKMAMEKMKRLRERYEKIQMTSQQAESVREVIETAKQKKRRKNLRSVIRKISAAAAVIGVFILLPNTSPTVAHAMQDIPVLGAVARIVTFRSYVDETEDLKASVNIPSIEMIEGENSDLAEAVNREIHELCEQYSREAIQRAEEYRTAFLETGGTQEEWETHKIEITVDYEIKSQTEEFLSFTVIGAENWNSGCNETRYYNLDLQKEELITLEDVLGEDYINIANAQIREQIRQRTGQNGEVFFSPEEGGFTSISEETKFYMNQAGKPVIIFDKYEIAPGSAGVVEFEIEK